ncbi:MAG: S41 family peptidase [Christensenella sp.]|nr:S41 family peptidase [Christensenella sp.]
MEKKKVLILCAAVALTASFVTGMFVYFFNAAKLKGNEIRAGSGSYQDIQKYMEISDLEQIINENFYQDAGETLLVNGTLKGMVDALGDRYSVYYTEEEYRDFNEKSESDLVGIGVSVGPYQNSGDLKVERVYAGSSAESAGIAEGDVITAVDGIALARLDYESASGMLKGPSGSSMTLSVNSAGELKEIPITRANVDRQYVTYTMLDDFIAEIVISEFSGNCVEEFKTALQFVRDQGAKGVVVDLRGNMQGSVKDAVSMLDEILPEGLAVYSVDKAQQRDEMTVDGEYYDIPMTVLVDGNTASAAEVFAGALQDRQRAVLVGSKTYGMGVIQSVIDMPYSGGGVKLTTAVYYTPNGTLINDGISPAVPVEIPAGITRLTFETDTQLQQGITSLRETIGQG